MPKAWTFETDIINPYAWSKSFLTKEECNHIIKEFEMLDQNNHTWDRVHQGMAKIHQDDQACNLSLYE